MSTPVQDPHAPPAQALLDEADALPPVAHLQLKATLLLLFTASLIIGSVLYLLHARGVFEPTQELILMADDSEGVSVGMDMTFSGFPIGRVRQISLAEDGMARIVIDVASKDARWLRNSSVFTLVRGVVGGTTIRAYTGVLDDEQLPPGAVRTVLRGDATAELPAIMSSTRELLEQLKSLTAPDAALAASLGEVKGLAERLNKAEGGLLQALTGNETDARQISAALARTNAILARVEGMATKADNQVFGPKGAVPQAQATLAQLDGLLADTRNTLRKVDALLAQAQGVASNLREGTTDLTPLRAEVEANLRKIDQLMGELQSRWPFASDKHIALP